jgi:hypothetical protein
VNDSRVSDGDLVTDDAGRASIDVEDRTVRIGATSPRMTALNQTLDSAPISTSPMTTEPGAK